MSFKQKVKDLLGIAKPGGIDDIVVRAVKTAVAVFLSQPFVALILQGSFDPNAARAAVYAAVAAGATVILNAALAVLAKFASS